MLRKFSVTYKLLLLVTILLVVIFGISIYSTAKLRLISRQSQSLYADRIYPIAELNDIRYAYSADVLNAVEQVQSRAMSFDHAASLIEEAKKIIDTSWAAYKLTYLTPEETKLASEMEAQMATANVHLNEMKQALANKDLHKVNEIDKRLNESVEKAISKDNQLAQLQLDVSRELNQSNVQVYESTVKNFFILIAVSLLTGCIVAFFIVIDIRRLFADLQESNRKIKANEEKFRAFIKYAGDSIIIVDTAFQITDANESACTLLGYTRSELLGMKISSIVPESELSNYSSRIEALRDTGASLHYRKYRRKDQSEVETEVNVKMLEGVGYIAIIRDISERKKAEQALKDSEQKYRYLFQNNPAYIIIWDPETLNVLEVNDGVIKKYGYTREEWANMSVLQYRPEQDHEKIRAFATNLLNSESPIARSTWTHLKKNGEEILMEISSHQIAYMGRHAILSLARDVTEQYRAEAALRTSEEKFRSLIDHAADAIFMVLDSGVIFDVNRSATELLGYSREELIGMTVLDLHPVRQKQIAPTLWETVRKEKSLLNELWLVRKDGTEVEVEISRKMLDDGSGAIAIVRDITDRKRAENRIKEREAQLTAIFENMEGATSLLDTDKKYILFNNRFIEDYKLLTGREPLIGQVVYDHFPEEVQKERFQMLDKVLQGNREVIEVNYLRDGKRVYYRTAFSPVITDGKVTGISTYSIDLTKSKEDEIKIRQSEEKNRALVENIGDAIILIDENNKVIYQSPSTERITGYSFEDRTHLQTNEFVYEEDREMVEGIIQISKNQPNVAFNYQCRLHHKNGSIIWIDAVIINLLHNESVKALVVNYRDVTERKIAQKALEQSEEKHRALTENITDAIMLLDEKFANIYQSPSVERITGYSMDDGSSKFAFDFIHPDDIRTGTQLLQSASANPGIPVYGQFRIQHKQGHYIWIEGSVINLLHDDSVKALIVNYRDISERKKFEEQQALMASIVGSTDDAIISKALNGIVTSWNHGAEKILGYTAEEMIGQYITKIIPADLKGEENIILFNVGKGQTVDHYETRRLRKDGREIYVSLTVSPIRDILGNVVGASKIMRDITEKKIAEDKIKELNEGLEIKVAERTSDLMEANKALEAFSYSVSHDLRAPVRAVISFTKIIQDEYLSELNDDIKQLFGHIASSSKRMNSIIDDLLTLAKYEKMKMRPEPVNMKALFENIWDSISYNAPHKAQLEITDLPTVHADSSLIEQVVVNLLSNAIKYSSKKEQPQVKVSYEEKESSYTFCVKDNGAGFDMKHYDRLFGAFQRLHGSSEFEGTGVGLLLVKSILEKHDGKVWAESKVDEGASFYFTLPYAPHQE